MVQRKEEANMKIIWLKFSNPSNLKKMEISQLRLRLEICMASVGFLLSFYYSCNWWSKWRVYWCKYYKKQQNINFRYMRKGKHDSQLDDISSNSSKYHKLSRSRYQRSNTRRDHCQTWKWHPRLYISWLPTTSTFNKLKWTQSQ